MCGILVIVSPVSWFIVEIVCPVLLCLDANHVGWFRSGDAFVIRGFFATVIVLFVFLVKKDWVYCGKALRWCPWRWSNSSGSSLWFSFKGCWNRNNSLVLKHLSFLRLTIVLLRVVPIMFSLILVLFFLGIDWWVCRPLYGLFWMEDTLRLCQPDRLEVIHSWQNNDSICLEIPIVVDL